MREKISGSDSFPIVRLITDAISDSGNIEISARSEKQRVVLSIVDDGQGIPPGVLPQIFDPFFTTKPPGQGTGLGLEITRRLVRRYHGDISVKSQPGQTTFQVRFLVEKPVPNKVDQLHLKKAGE